MPSPLADCGGERVGSARSDGNAGCNGRAANGRVGVRARNRLGAGDTACAAGGGSGGGGGKAADSVEVGSTGDDGRGAGPEPRAPLVLCDAGWLDGACGI